jgi:hypothetical protein
VPDFPESLRTIGEIALHVGSSKVMYTDYALRLRVTHLGERRGRAMAA